MKTQSAFILQVTATVMAAAILAISANAENWPQWRGPFLNGSTSEKDLPITWSKENATWMAEMPGPGAATPIIWEDRVFVSAIETESKKMWAIPTGADGKIYCISMGGEVVVLSRIDMGEGDCRSTISAAHGQLFVRTAENLYCIGKKME